MATMTDLYQYSAVTFLDILGFRKITSTVPPSDITAMLDAISKTAGKPIGEAGDHTQVLSFSDSIIRVRPADANSPFEALLFEVQDLAVAQWSLLETGILVRGGCTIGDVAASPGRAFGPAFVRAYDLETSLASAPRIIIDPLIIERLRQAITALPKTSQRLQVIDELRQQIRLGSDGLWFVDFLSSVPNVMKSESDIVEALCSIRRVILNEVAKLSPEPTSLVLPKLLWLIRYFNASCKRLYPERSELKIVRREVPASDELLRPKPFKKKRKPRSSRFITSSI